MKKGESFERWQCRLRHDSWYLRSSVAVSRKEPRQGVGGSKCGVLAQQGFMRGGSTGVGPGSLCKSLDEREIVLPDGCQNQLAPPNGHVVSEHLNQLRQI